MIPRWDRREPYQVLPACYDRGVVAVCLIIPLSELLLFVLHEDK